MRHFPVLTSAAALGVGFDCTAGAPGSAPRTPARHAPSRGPRAPGRTTRAAGGTCRSTRVGTAPPAATDAGAGEDDDRNVA